MKTLFLILPLFFHTLAYAKNTLALRDHAQVAKSVVTELYGQPEDQVTVEGLGTNNSSFDVSLSNSSEIGSVTYNVEIDQEPVDSETEDLGELKAVIKIRLVDSN